MVYDVVRQLCLSCDIEVVGLPRWPELPHGYLSVYRLLVQPEHVAAVPSMRIVTIPLEERGGKTISQWRSLAHRLAPDLPAARFPEPYLWRRNSPHCADLLRELLASCPSMFDSVPGLREQAESALCLEELI